MKNDQCFVEIATYIVHVQYSFRRCYCKRF